MKRLTVPALIVVAVALAAWLALRTPQRAAPVAATAPAVGRVEPVAVTSTSASPPATAGFTAFAPSAVTDARPAPAPQPPVDTLAVSELLRVLDEPARQGDVLAACRLATELLRCRGIARWDERQTQYQIEGLARSKVSGAELERRTQALVEAETYNLAVRARCAGIGAEELRLIPRYAFAAAQRGHVPSMLLFADAAGVAGQDIIADPALYAAYRAHAWPMFQRAFEAGHPRAASAWSWALNSNGYRFLGGVLPPEWQRPGLALALIERLRRDLPRASTALSQPVPVLDLKPSDAERAEAEALYARHFADSPWVRALADSAPPENPRAGRHALDPRACDEP